MSGNTDTREESRIGPISQFDDEALTDQRETDILQLRRIEGVGSKLARRLLERFGSVSAVSSAASSSWGDLKEVRGINSEMARDFFDRMCEAGVYRSVEDATTDDVRRGMRTKAYHDANGALGDCAAITGIHQALTGHPTTSLVVAFDLPDAVTSTTFTVTFPKGATSYDNLLTELGVRDAYYADTPENIRVHLEDKIIGQRVPFRFGSGFVIELDGEEYRV